VSVGEKPPKPDRRQYALNVTLAAVTSQVGCLTVVIILVALLGGLWLDNIFNTKPWFTLGLVALSFPVTLVTMFAVVRWTTGRMLPPEEPENKNEEQPSQEDENIG
jgi:F0F1-type ATP synthase assembly protein I